MMLRKDLLNSLLIAILSLGFAGSAFAAGERTIDSEAGLYKNGDRTTVTNAAEQHKYNQERLSNVGTEADNWRIDANTSSSVCINC